MGSVVGRCGGEFGGEVWLGGVVERLVGNLVGRFGGECGWECGGDVWWGVLLDKFKD